MSVVGLLGLSVVGLDVGVSVGLDVVGKAVGVLVGVSVLGLDVVGVDVGLLVVGLEEGVDEAHRSRSSWSHER